MNKCSFRQNGFTRTTYSTTVSKFAEENLCLYAHRQELLGVWPPGVLGIWGEWLFIFRDLGSTGNYFRGAGEQAHSFGDLGSPAKKQKK